MITSTPSLLITLITYLVRGIDVTPLVEQRLQALHIAVHCRQVQGRPPILKDDNGYRYEERGWGEVKINGMRMRAPRWSKHEQEEMASRIDRS